MKIQEGKRQCLVVAGTYVVSILYIMRKKKNHLNDKQRKDGESFITNMNKGTCHFSLGTLKGMLLGLDPI